MKNVPDGIPMIFVLLAGAVFVVVTLGGLILLAWARNADARTVRKFAAVPLMLGALAIGLVLVRLDQPRLIRRGDLPAGEPQSRAGGAQVAPGAWPEGLAIARFAACDDEMWVD